MPFDREKYLASLQENRAKHPGDLHRIFKVRAGDRLEGEPEGTMVVEGEAIVFNDQTVLYEDPDDGFTIRETIAPEALANTDMSDVFMRYNHSNDQPPLCRCHGENKGLTLTVHEGGLHIRGVIIDNQFGRDIYASIKRGDIDKMSFAFRSAGDEINEVIKGGKFMGADIVVRNITKLIDVAPVMVPAYENTEIGIRRKLEVEAFRASLEEQKRAHDLKLAKLRAGIKI